MSDECRKKHVFLIYRTFKNPDDLTLFATEQIRNTGHEKKENRDT